MPRVTLHRDREIAAAMSAARRAGDVGTAVRLLVARWEDIREQVDAEARRQRDLMAGRRAYSGTSLLHHLDHIRGRMRDALREVDGWPAAALAAIDEPALADWEPYLIGLVARRPDCRTAMVARARLRCSDSGELGETLIDIACRDGDRILLDAGVDLVRAADRRPVSRGLRRGAADTIIDAYCVFSLWDEAMRVALDAVRAGHPSHLYALLKRRRWARVPAEALDALAALREEPDRARAAVELRLAGFDADAAALEARLVASGGVTLGRFTQARRLAAHDPGAALEAAAAALEDAHRYDGRLDHRCSHELTEFLRAVKPTPALAPRLLLLAEAIGLRPMREEIVANVGLAFLAAGEPDRARSLLDGMVNDVQRRRLMAALATSVGHDGS